MARRCTAREQRPGPIARDTTAAANIPKGTQPWGPDAKRLLAPASTPPARTHHRELHHSGSEFRWWEVTGIDPLKIARELWKNTRLNGRSQNATVLLQKSLQISLISDK